MTDAQQQLPLPAPPTDAPVTRRRRSARRRRSMLNAPPPTPVTLWMLRILVNGRGLRSLAELRAWPDADVLEGLGLPADFDQSFAEPPDAAPLREVEALFSRWLGEVEKAPLVRDQAVFRNVAWLGERLGLSTIEQDLLAFSSLVHTEQGLSDCFRRTRGGNFRARANDLLARMLGVGVDAVAHALRSDGALVSLRLVRSGGIGLHPSFAINVAVNEGLGEVLRVDHATPEALLSRFFTVAPPATLTLEDYAHAGKSVKLVTALIAKVLAARAPGVNILFVGPPGTGKTELARTVAAATDALLHEVSVSDDDDDPASGMERLMNYGVCQRLLARAPRALVVFDELEDAFPRSVMGSFGMKVESHPAKGWVNRTLDTNPVPTIWIGNHADQLDTAFLRRFSVVVELPDPPPRVRARIIRHHTAKLGVSDAWIERHAPDRRLRPGHIQSAARVAGLLAPTTPEAAEELLNDVFEAALTLEGPAVAQAGSNDACDYDPTLVNADVDLGRLVAGLKQNPRGSICLYGPPGTGKTAFVTQLAAQLELPLFTRRASELLGKYVGETEKNISEMFREAEAEGAVLFLDEADSFLQKRERATQQWEKTQVNELLVAAERFRGLFVCATNLMDDLDTAMYRRLSLKIRFSPLNPAQRARMLGATVARLGGAVDPEAMGHLRSELDRLPELTAGDFAAVARRLRLLGGTPTAADVVRGLEEEHRWKPASTARRAGFGSVR